MYTYELIVLPFSHKAIISVYRYRQKDRRTEDRTSEDASDPQAPSRTYHIYKEELPPAS